MPRFTIIKMVGICNLIIFLCFPWGLYFSSILFLAPMPVYSHFTLIFRLAKAAAERGHLVTVVSPYPQKTPIKNYTHIYLEENLRVVKGKKIGFKL